MSIVEEIAPNEYRLNLGSSSEKSSSVNSLSANVNTDNKFVIATDCDDVLVNISDKWINKAINHPVIGKYFKDSNFSLFGTHLMRDHYYILESFGVTDPEHCKIFNDLYFQDPEFYDNLLPLPFMNSLKAMNDYSIGRIAVVTTSGETKPSLPCNISKAKWLLRHFKDVNPAIEVSIHFLEAGKGKGEYMWENNIVFNTFVDDAMSNVIEVINSTPYSGYEIMIPAYGHNQNFATMKAQLKNEQHCKIIPFHNFLHITQKDMMSLISE